MTESKRILKELGLNFKEIVPEQAWKIKPLDFLSEIYIVLVDEGSQYCMFIWKNNGIQKECKFKEISNVTDVYSFLYNYDKKNLKKHNGII